MSFPTLKFDLKTINIQVANLERLTDICAIDPRCSYIAWIYLNEIKLLIQVKKGEKTDNISLGAVSYDNWSQFLKTNIGINITFPHFVEVQSSQELDAYLPDHNTELFFVVETNGARFMITECDHKLPILIFDKRLILFQLMNKLNPEANDWVHGSYALKSFCMRTGKIRFNVSSSTQLPFRVMEHQLRAPIRGTRLIEI
jgi:hypothetical protein